MKSLDKLRKIMIMVLGVSLAVPGIAQAAHVNITRGNQQVVSYADLDLASDEAVVVLYQRLKHAAQSVCGLNNYGIGPRIISRSVLQSRQACAAQSLERAVAGVNNQHLTALHTQDLDPRVAINF